HAAAGVDELLLARVERMAVRADFDMQLGLRRTGLELVPARAVNGCQDVFGMDSGFHSPARIATVVWVATLPPETTATTVSAGSSWIFPATRGASEAAPRGAAAGSGRW